MSTRETNAVLAKGLREAAAHWRSRLAKYAAEPDAIGALVDAENIRLRFLWDAIAVLEEGDDASLAASLRFRDMHSPETISLDHVFYSFLEQRRSQKLLSEIDIKIYMLGPDTPDKGLAANWTLRRVKS